MLRYFVVKIDIFKLEGRSNMFLSDMSSYLEAHLDLSLLPFSDHIIWPYLAYLGAYLSAPNIFKRDISKKILQNAVQSVDLVSIGPPVKRYDQINILADFPTVITIRAHNL